MKNAMNRTALIGLRNPQAISLPGPVSETANAITETTKNIFAVFFIPEFSDLIVSCLSARQENRGNPVHQKWNRSK
jgi:hypothetical protein